MVETIWKMIKVPSQWPIKKIIGDWIKFAITEAVREAVDKEKGRIVSSSIAVKKLEEYDKVHDEFSKHIS